MSSPILPLRAAIRALCLADAPLAALMDRAIHDEAPRGGAPAHATFGDVVLRDASSSTERGHEQEIAIRVWARPGSAASALKAADRLVALLDDSSPPLPGHRLVSLTVTAIETERDPDSDTILVTIRLRAVTEVA
ncbi:DUF3168 domain-containing protein [Enterovirga rhinocerotis]|uniref:Uncharacterized protein DUF3168 n=1 Tax=Enterovirga rhinocerotis TaxID=1339210 RepID=A0A4R7BT93_9HYPH|nr:DUF3168 domain-containing protein [Enterovirga rhinocerotis]TDR88958.1 uncharacterized protein DUF3168 [Enterovirga rhinocerotis]